MAAHTLKPTQIGLIVNPMAGLGGRVGLKGSDGVDVQLRARALGAKPQAETRAILALQELLPLRDSLRLLTFPAEMGENAARVVGLEYRVIGQIESGRTTAADTERAARIMQAEGVRLLLFVGGDGTARDIQRVVGESLATVGVPAGVKMHSAVYATTPKAAGQLARQFLEGKTRELCLAEVMDIDEDAFRQGVVSARLYGYLLVPQGRRLLQGAKAASSHSERAAQAEIAAAVVAQMEEERLYVVGPGTTTRAIFRALGLPKTLLGVDVVKNGRLVATDVSAPKLEALITPDTPLAVIVTPIGGQGFLFGRGNQQISPVVLRKAGKEHLIVVATPAKIHGLKGRPLLIDSGDPAVDALFQGYIRVQTGFRQSIVYPLAVM
ncbi:MAG: ATP-NAD kinase family protein [Chloroflexi bacterium]|nr:ATP-NAD kinase family protein [Chloroflexota bacterium]